MDSATIPDVSKLLLPKPGRTSVLSSDEVCERFKFVSPMPSQLYKYLKKFTSFSKFISDQTIISCFLQIIINFCEPFYELYITPPQII